MKRKRVIDKDLTARDLVILILVATGYTNDQIALFVGIKSKTVAHILGNEDLSYSVYRKIGVTSRPEAAVWVKEHYSGLCFGKNALVDMNYQELLNQVTVMIDWGKRNPNTFPIPSISDDGDEFPIPAIPGMDIALVSMQSYESYVHELKPGVYLQYLCAERLLQSEKAIKQILRKEDRDYFNLLQISIPIDFDQSLNEMVFNNMKELVDKLEDQPFSASDMVYLDEIIGILNNLKRRTLSKKCTRCSKNNLAKNTQRLSLRKRLIQNGTWESHHVLPDFSTGPGRFLAITQTHGISFRPKRQY